jgi:hypothetical protein
MALLRSIFETLTRRFVPVDKLVRSVDQGRGSSRVNSVVHRVTTNPTFPEKSLSPADRSRDDRYLDANGVIRIVHMPYHYDYDLDPFPSDHGRVIPRRGLEALPDAERSRRWFRIPARGVPC